MDMNNRVLFCLLLLLQSNTTPPPQQSTTPNSAQQLPTAACKQPCLEDGTPVRLRMSQTVSSADAHVNDRVEFEVLEDIKVADVLVIPKGGIAWGDGYASTTEAPDGTRRKTGDCHGLGSFN